MDMNVRRRGFLKMASGVCAAGVLGGTGREMGAMTGDEGNNESVEISDLFPTQAPELVREMVTVSHYSLSRVKELVEARPSLARASWDWGFGDWESALGAASHMGNRPIAEYLIGKGARPSLFSAAMLGQLEVVKAFVAVAPGVQWIAGPHSIPLLAHAKAGGEAARGVFDFLNAVGDAGAEALAPLTDADAEKVRGTYVFGPAANQTIDVTVEKGQVLWTRRGTMGRPLYYLGEKVFYPAGARAVKVRFREEGDGVTMTVEDPEVVLMARRRT